MEIRMACNTCPLFQDVHYDCLSLFISMNQTTLLTVEDPVIDCNNKLVFIAHSNNMFILADARTAAMNRNLSQSSSSKTNAMERSRVMSCGRIWKNVRYAGVLPLVRVWSCKPCLSKRLFATCLFSGKFPRLGEFQHK